MDFLTFVTKVFDAWAWPLVVLSIVDWFRDDIKKLLPTLLSVKGAGFEATFGKKIEEAGETAIEVAAEAPLPPDTAPPKDAQAAPAVAQTSADPMTAWQKRSKLWLPNQLFLDAIEHPEQTIIEAWEEVERTVIEFATAVRGEPIAVTGSPPVGWLEQFGVTPSEGNLYMQLRHLRNLLINEKEATVSRKQASEYVRLATTLIQVLRNRILALEARRKNAEGAGE